jgi:hypothetical protein
MHLISDDEWPSYLSMPMQRLSQEEKPPFDFWPYVEAIPKKDFNGFDCSEGDVDYVYRHPAGRLVHVLINSNDRAVFMVIVIDKEACSVIGHRLLDLPQLYGVHEEGD